MTTFIDFEFANAKHDASPEFIQFPEKWVDLSNFIVIFNVMLKRVFQFWFFILLLQLNIHFESFNDASLFFIHFFLFVGIFWDSWQIDIEILLTMQVEIVMIFIEHL